MHNVTDIKAQPRIVNDQIGKHKFTVMYNPDTRAWEWSASIALSYPLHGQHKTLELARAAARKAIERFVKSHEDLDL